MRARDRLVPMTVVFLLAVVVVVGFRSLAPQSIRPLEASDFRWYSQVAENVKDGQGLTLDDGRLATDYPPGYPLILAGLFGIGDAIGVAHGTVMDFFIPLVMAGCAVLVFAVARRLFDTTVAWLAALLWVGHPMNLALSSQPYSELPFTLLVYVAVLIFIAAFQAERMAVRWMLLVGALVGAASLVRSIAIGLVAAFLVAAWSWSRGRQARWRAGICLALLAGNLLAVLPWEIYAHQRTGKVITLSSAGGDTLHDGLTMGYWPGQQGSIALPGDVRELLETVADHPEAYRSTGEIARLLADTFAERPATVLKLFAIKAARAWYGTTSLRLERVLVPVQLLYLGLVVAGMITAVRGARHGGRAVWLLVPIAAYFWLITTMVLPLLRYMAAALGLLLVFAAYCLAMLLGRVRTGSAHQGERSTMPVLGGSSTRETTDPSGRR